LARQANTTLTGTRGSRTYYKMNGEYFVRLKSSGGKQTQRTKARQEDFAIAASLSKKIRLLLYAAIPDPKQKAMQNRLTQALLQWQFSRAVQPNDDVITQLENFQFIKEAPLTTIFTVPVAISKTKQDAIEMIIPSFKPKRSIKAPPHTKQVHINIAAGRCSITQQRPLERIYKQLMVTYNNQLNKQQIISLPFTSFQPSVTVIAISLTYWVQQPNNPGLLRVKQNTWSPAAIIYAVKNESAPA